MGFSPPDSNRPGRFRTGSPFPRTYHGTLGLMPRPIAKQYQGSEDAARGLDLPVKHYQKTGTDVNLRSGRYSI
jgi:hypothetical protein